VSGGGLVWFRVRWPREVGSDRLKAVSLLLASTRGPAVVEALGRAGSVEHRLAVGRAHADALVEQLRVVLPGIGLTPLDERPPLGARLSAEVRLSSPHRPLRLDQPELVSRALITALAASTGRRRDDRAVGVVADVRPRDRWQDRARRSH